MQWMCNKRTAEPGRRKCRNCLIVCLSVLVLTLLAGACRTGAEEKPTQANPTLENTRSLSPTASPTTGFSEIRLPAVADAFYPADAAAAEGMLETYLAPVQRVDGEPIALIVPHAGWIYSGQVAAAAYKQIQGIAYDTVVVIGPNHSDPTFDAISVYAKGAFETPFGLAAIDEALAAKLVAASEQIVFDRDVHAQEHSIEVQLPFLQRVCPDCRYVPIIIGKPTSQNVQVLTAALIEELRGKNALIIASSDLSHYPDYDHAVEVDMRTLAAIETLDDTIVSAVTSRTRDEQIPGLVTCACGQGPIAVAMRVSQALGADHVRILRYANSGDVSGDPSRVVGYAAVMFWQWQPPNLTAPQQAELLAIARHSLVEYYASGAQTGAVGAELSIAAPPDNALNRRLGAFVTLTVNDELRGCIGEMHSDAPLYQTVARTAVEAATRDPRFPPLPPDQLDDVTIEISVLSPFDRVRDVSDEEEIVVGRDGLYLLYGQQRGVLLPQVPVENQWDRAQYLEQICFKAGLPGDCWEKATLYTFTAEVFSEHPEQ